MAYIVTSYLRLLTYYITQVSDSSTCYFIIYNFSSGMLSTNLLKILVHLLIRVSLLTSHFSERDISDFSLPLSCFTSSQSYNVWAVVCSPILQGHIGLSIILYLYRYDLILPWPVTIIVRVWNLVCHIMGKTRNETV